MITKRCSCCGEDLNREKFTRDKRKKDGLCVWCKLCHRQYSKDWRRKNSKKKRANNRNYYQRNLEYFSKRSARQRGLGFNPLNKFFPGCHWHHINDQNVVAIPGYIHMMYECSNAGEHRRLVLEHYGSIENMKRGIEKDC